MSNITRKLCNHRIFQKIIAVFSACSLVVLSFSFSAYASAEAAQAKISSDLQQRMEETTKDDMFPVVVWVNDIQYDESTVVAQADAVLAAARVSDSSLSASSSRTNNVSALLSSGDDPDELNDTQIHIEAKRKILSDMYIESNAAIKQTLLTADKTISDKQVKWVSEYTPIMQMNLTKSQIIALSKENIVEGIYLDDYEPVYEEELSTSSSSENSRSEFPYDVWQGATYVDYVKNTLGYDGSGVKVGVIDNGVIRYEELNSLAKSAFSTLHNEGRLVPDPDAPAGYAEHAFMSTAVIAATDGIYVGVAPGVTIYSSCGDERTGDIYGAIEWQISKGCRVISMSMSSTAYSTYDAYAKWLDHLAIQHDVTIVKSAGNYKNNVNVGIGGGGMSYNAIVVGASDSNGTKARTDDVRKSDSCYYTGSTLAMKPDIMAPGTNVVVATSINYAQTSAATPQVAGIIALMYEMRPALESNQAVTKAILLAGISGCNNLSGTSTAGGTTTAMKTQSGAGLVDAKAMRYVTQNNRFAGGTLQAGGSYRKTFTVSSSDTLTRVALTWLKNNRITGSHSAGSPTISNGDCATLYLKVTSPSGVVYRSQCTRGNVQLISFNPTEAGTYTIDVTVQEASSNESNIYYGLAWY